MKLYKVLFLLISVFGYNLIENVKSETSSAIPELLQNCYRNNVTIIAKPPKTLNLLLELLRKIEFHEGGSFSLRTFTATLMQSVVLDGIRKTDRVLDENLILPYAASGDEFDKYKLIIDYLIPKDTGTFTSGFLEMEQLCFLHKLLSDVTEDRIRGDETSTCDASSSMPYYNEFDNDDKSTCPIKQGVIKTKWGSIAPGRLLAAVAAAQFDLRTIKFQRIENDIKLKNTTMETSTSTPTTSTPRNNDVSHNVNTMWVSSIAGDLAEVVLKQAEYDLIIGKSGFWNDTLLPTNYYLKSNTNNEFTEDEILGGIDGIIIAENAKLWQKTFDTIKLSQLIDMYYNERVNFDNYNYYVASDRSAAFNKSLDNVNLKDQVEGSAKLLKAISNHYDKTLSNNDVSKLLTPAIEQFQKVATNLISTYESVENINGGVFNQHTPMEIILIMDGTFDKYTAQQFIYVLAETFEVSVYGSQLGVINGQSTNWLTNITAELFELFIDLNRADEEWPVTLSLGSSLETVINYYENKTTSDCSLTYIKPISKSILVFSSDGRLTDTDSKSTKLAIKTIKDAYPETNILYISEDLNNLFSELATNDYGNDYVIKPNKDIISLVTTISDKLNKVPANIFLNYCNHSQVRFEDYITTNVETRYAIRREYVEKGLITTNFKNYDYGHIQICGTTSKSNPSNRLCKNLTVNGELSFKSEEICTDTSTCDVYYLLIAENSTFKCAENACRYPDQIRLTITYSYNSTTTYLPNIILLAFVIIICLFN